MKTVKIFIALLLFAPAMVQAQDQDLSKMLTEIADGIKPEAFTDDFADNKAEWTESANNLDTSDMSAVSQQVGSLVKGLKGKAFKKGAHKKLLGSLAKMGDLSDVGSLLTNLVNGLDPSMLTGALAGDKSSLLKGLAGL